MELSFAVARSKDKECGICMDTVLNKEPKSERRFGILSDCVHCFCLACIRKWRASKQFDSKTIRYILMYLSICLSFCHKTPFSQFYLFF